MSRYLILGSEVSATDEGFVGALAAAHAARQRPLCLCVEGDSAQPEMYVARLRQVFVLKRMPGTGSRHAPRCPSYEPLPEASGLGQVLNTAIAEDPATGETKLKLDFALSKIGSRSAIPPAGEEGDSVSSAGTRLSLRGLLHFLWDEAELTRWHPGFAGKRSWATVRRHLLLAAENKTAGGRSLLGQLYVPEVFSVEQRDAINARRVAHWCHAARKTEAAQHLLLLVGEAKEFVRSRCGFKAVIKHVPDHGFVMDEQLYQRLGRRFEKELGLWASSAGAHMIVIATVAIGESGVPMLVELSLMPVTDEWLPIEDAYDRYLVERLVTERRSFIKGLRYNLGRKRRLASATLTDAGGCGRLLFIFPPTVEDFNESSGHPSESADASWVWRPQFEAFPPLPPLSGSTSFGGYGEACQAREQTFVRRTAAQTERGEAPSQAGI